jgi:hypothetical protein
MKNPLQQRIHEPKNPHQLMMEQGQKKQKEEQDALRKKAESLLLPLFLKNSENVLDAIVWANTLSAKVQELAAERAVKMKVSDYEKELRLNTTAKHGERYDSLIDTIKDMTVEESVKLLNEIKLIINNSIDAKFSKVKLEDFLEKKSGIILPNA